MFDYWHFTYTIIVLKIFVFNAFGDSGEKTLLILEYVLRMVKLGISIKKL